MENNTYISILADTLVKKEKILDELLEQTVLQGKYLTNIPSDVEQFDKIFAIKGRLIGQLNQLDQGFEKVYDYVRAELNVNGEVYKVQINSLQQLVSRIMDKSTNLQAAEMKNKAHMEIYINNRKEDIKQYKKSNKTVSNYYKSMASQYQEQSFFLDKKK